MMEKYSSYFLCGMVLFQVFQEVTSSNSSTNIILTSISSTFTETAQPQLSKLTENVTRSISNNTPQSTTATQMNGGNVSTPNLLTSSVKYQKVLSSYGAVSNALPSFFTPLLYTTKSIVTQQMSSQINNNKLHTTARNQEDIIAISILLGICGLTVVIPITFIAWSLLCRKKT